MGVINRFLNNELENILIESRETILKEWFTLVVETYPAETSKFLKSQKNPFANPVGRAVRNGVEDLFDVLLRGLNREHAGACLDPMIRIRAIQNFTPSEAIGFIFSLKAIIRKIIGKKIVEKNLLQDVYAFESKIDDLGLIAFDIYMKCREKIYEIKANEFRNRHYSAFRRAGLISEVPDDPALKQ
jgi:hypothetical protein